MSEYQIALMMARQHYSMAPQNRVCMISTIHGPKVKYMWELKDDDEVILFYPKIQFRSLTEHWSMVS